MASERGKGKHGYIIIHIIIPCYYLYKLYTNKFMVYFIITFVCFFSSFKLCYFSFQVDEKQSRPKGWFSDDI